MKNFLFVIILFFFTQSKAQKVGQPIIIKNHQSLSTNIFEGILAANNVLFSENFESGTSFPLNGIVSKSDATDNGFMIGDTVKANLGQIWHVPYTSNFAFTNDDKCNCNKANDSLILPTQNLLNNTIYQLRFNAYFYPTSLKEKAQILVKNNGKIQLLKELESIDEWKAYTLPLKNVVGNTQIIFYYSDGGSWATGLAIDDIEICEPNEGVNITLSNLQFNETPTTSFYNEIPAHQASKTKINLTSTLTNFGKLDATNLSAFTEISGNEISNAQTTPFNLEANEDSNLLMYPNFYAANGSGDYNFKFWIKSDSIETNTEKDTLKTTINITDTIYSRTGRKSTPGAGFWFGPGINYSIASLFEINTPDTATSITVFIDKNSTIGSTFDVIILNEFFQDKVIPLANPQSDQNIQIEPHHLGNWVSIKIPETSLRTGKYYVGIKSRTGRVIVGVSEYPAAKDLVNLNIGTGNSKSKYLPFIKLNVKERKCSLLTSIKTTKSNCGSADGSVSISASGGQTPYQIQWDNKTMFSQSISVSGLSAATYFVTISDSLGCSTTSFADISDTNGAIITTNNLTNETCFGQKAGNINISASGGTQPYRYLWNNNVTDTINSNLSAGIYSVTVTDGSLNNCKTIASFEVLGPKQSLQVDFVTTHNTCFNNTNGVIQTIVSGGVKNYTYTWSASTATSRNLTNLKSGTYYITITDANACTLKDSIKINGTEPITISSTISYTGNLGEITVEANGGEGFLSYFWTGPNDFKNPGTKDLDGLKNRGTYIIEVVDQQMCSVKDTTEVLGSVGLENNLNLERITAFPNPSSSSITISLNDSENGSFTLVNALGKIINQQHFKNINQLIIPKPGKGIYYLSIEYKGKRIHKKLLFID